MQFKEKYHYLAVFVLFIFISFFLANYVGFNRHWIVNHDHEFTLIYNALLFNSHLPLEYIQHPGFFTILFLSLFIKLLSFFDLITVYNLSLLNSENFDGGFQELIFFTRIYSTISVSLFCCVSYAFFYKFSKHKAYSYILSLLIFFSQGTIFHFAQLRTELIAMFFIILSLICLKTFLEDGKKYKLLYLSGFFLFIICALLNKMQVFFLLPLYIAILYFCENKIDNFNVTEYNFLNKKWVPYTLFFIVIFYIFKGTTNIFDPVPMLSTIALISNIFFMNLFFLLILKKQPETIKINLVVINLCFILVFFLTKNFLLIHPSASESIFIELTRIMNLSQYISSAPDITDTLNFTYSLFTQFFINFLSILNQIIFKLNIYSLVIILNCLITIIFRKFLTAKMIKFNFTCIAISILIIVINSYRAEGNLLPHYMIFSELIIVLSLCNFYKFLKTRYLILIFILICFVNFQNNLKYINQQRIHDYEIEKNLVVNVCKNNYFTHWHKKINKEYFVNLCNNYNN